MFSKACCGSKIADFCGTISDNICVGLPAADINECLTSFDQIFRRLLLKAYVQKRTLQLSIIIDSKNTVSEEEKANLEQSTIEAVKKIEAEIVDEVSTQVNSIYNHY